MASELHGIYRVPSKTHVIPVIIFGKTFAVQHGLYELIKVSRSFKIDKALKTLWPVLPVKKMYVLFAKSFSIKDE